MAEMAVDEEIILRDGGVLNLGREHAFYMPCGYGIAASEKLLLQSREDVLHSLQKIASNHRRVSHDEGQSQVCDAVRANVVWTSG